MTKNIQKADVETGVTALENLVKENHSLNKKMEQAIIKVVKENGGLVRTDDPDCFSICAYVFNNDTGHYEESKILAIATSEDDNLSVLIGEEYETLDDMTNDEILESSDCHYITEDYIFETPTLACICEFLEEHI